ncbi:putative metal-dependent hydrolase of the TIM-barrel fold protein [Hartmannibacter diazotrophicus]|uniref:Putative metal-dependent hydrolase of the TIM-barrel fold protein n=1 Tax=Hartmannibacter diazotrophicus TaxID=1482074 RepID=A0A2C9D8J9_9HYPH|nr:amidohydrolase family protein [Hartmannibacter diazotrophicus]SON56654.1 putative metal-dependent hydrolase of the TIM-barrel fold protein [Hartmannibacter diazotrophicus]
MIDAHQHFWTLSRGDYPWPNETVAPIFRDFSPDDLRPLLAHAGVEQTVLVQATDTVAETEFLLELADANAFVAGVVGWVDLSAPTAIETIDRLRESRWLKGLRPMLQNIEDTNWILRPEIQPALAHMAKKGLRFDALIQPRHLKPLLEVARAHPELNIVVDHVAKPHMGGGRAPDPAWLQGMLALAGRANVWCKLSGMVTEIGPQWQPGDIGPFARHVLDAFGPARTMWGSDWPVVDLASDYQTWVETARILTADLNEMDRERVFEGTARAFYGLEQA